MSNRQFCLLCCIMYYILPVINYYYLLLYLPYINSSKHIAKSCDIETSSHIQLAQSISPTQNFNWFTIMKRAHTFSYVKYVRYNPMPTEYFCIMKCLMKIYCWICISFVLLFCWYSASGHYYCLMWFTYILYIDKCRYMCHILHHKFIVIPFIKIKSRLIGHTVPWKWKCDII